MKINLGIVVAKWFAVFKEFALLDHKLFTWFCIGL